MWYMRVQVISVVVSALKMVPSSLDMELDILEISGRIESSIVEIVLNSKKSPRNQKQLDVTLSTLKDHRVTLI